MRSLMLFVADLRLEENAELSRIQTLKDAEAKAVYAIAAEGRLEAMFLYADHSGAMLILKAQDQAAARLDIQNLPYVREGLLTARVTPLAAYPPLAALYEKDGRQQPEWWGAAASADH